MGLTDGTATTTDSQNLADVRQRFPSWDIDYFFGSWQAVPKGTPVIRGMYLETLAEKLAAQEDHKS